MKKFLAVLLTAAMLMGMMAVPAFADGEEIAPSITSPVAGTKLDGATAQTIKATFPEGATSAKLYIRGEESDALATIEGENITFSNVSFSGFGKTDVKIVATYTDKTLEALATYTVVLLDDSEVFSYDIVNQNVFCWDDIFEANGVKARIYKGNSSFFPTNANLEIDNNKRTKYVTISEPTDTSLWLRIPQIELTNVLTDARLTAEYNVAFHNSSNMVFQVDVRSEEATEDNGGGWGSSLKDIIKEGKFPNGTEVADGEFYNLKLVYDTTTQTLDFTVSLANSEVYKTTKTDASYKSLKQLIFEINNISGIGTGAIIDGLSFKVNVAKPGATISNLSYSVDSSEVLESDWNGGKLNPVASSVNVNFEANVSAIADSVDAKLYKLNNGEWKTVEISNIAVSGTKVSIFPQLGFDEGAKYQIRIGEMKLGNATYSGEGNVFIADFTTGGAEFEIISPADNASYFDKDVVISVNSPNEEPQIKFDGVIVPVVENYPLYTATVSAADKALGLHDIVIEADGKEYKRTVELCSDIAQKFHYLYNEPPAQKVNMYNGAPAPGGTNYFFGSSLENGTFEKIQGKDGKEGVAFRMTKPADKTEPGMYDAYFKALHAGDEYAIARATGDAPYSISFDVKKGDGAGQVGFEAYNINGERVWLGNPQSFIGADGTIDRSDVSLPANEWHNLRLVWECKDAGKYWVYLDNALIYTHDSSKADTQYDLTTIKEIRFTVFLGSVDIDNLKYGKYIVNPSLENVTFDNNDEALEGNVISPVAEKIVLNLTGGFTSVSGVTVNGVAAASVEVSGNSVIITPAGELPANEVIDIVIGAGSVLSGQTLEKSIIYKAKTGARDDEVVSFTIEEGAEGSTAKLNFVHGFASDNEKLLVSIAAYSDNQLVGIKTGWCTLSVGENEFETGVLSIPDGATVKAFVRYKNMKPVAKVEK